MSHPFRYCAGFVVVMLFLGFNQGKAVAEPVADQIKALVLQASGNDAGSVASTSLEAAVLLPRFYEERGYARAWTDRNVEELFQALDRGIEQGLQPGDFHLPLLLDVRHAAQAATPAEIAAFDVIATDAAITLIHHIVFGKVDPSALDSSWNFDKPLIKRDPAVVLNEYLDGDGFRSLIERIDIDVPQYGHLVDALARYRSIVADGGWPQVPDQTVLKPGMTDPAVPRLRERLAQEGRASTNRAAPVSQTSTGARQPEPLLQIADDPGQNSPALEVAGQITPVLEAAGTVDQASPVAEAGVEPSQLYDEQLAADVRDFQARHGLAADGVVGPDTFASLNRAADERVDQIRLSLERGRWLMRELEDTFVLVNIAGARTYLAKSGKSAWTTRSVTGSAYRKTPVFRDDIKYMEFNPTWTVPNSIFRKDKLARIRRDPGYLARNNYTVVRTSDRSPVSSSAVNWAASNPGVTLVQRPGPNNALGLVKFMFPNKYAVYLHDTNNRDLFSQNERNLSSGCVRLEHPFEFANLLMEGAPDWSAARMQSILESGKTTRIDLPRPMPVLLTYWTAWVENGVVQFREDPYERDPPILEALNR